MFAPPCDFVSQAAGKMLMANRMTMFKSGSYERIAWLDSLRRNRDCQFVFAEQVK